MCLCGRAWPAVLFSRLLYLYTFIDVEATNDYGIPIEIKLWDNGRTPLAHMVDVTNGFGLKVLAEHNFLNDNNIAFSPYGLMGILVALYEGVDGESSYQIQMGMQLPWNRNIMRIGFRDIHRTLKTYFVPEEGFLAGLALNNENVTFNENYKRVLRFYGFDLETDKVPSTSNTTNATTSKTTTTSEEGAATTDASVSTMAGREDTSPTATTQQTTLNAETINELDVRGPTSATVSPSSASNAESTTIIPTQLITTSQQTAPTTITQTTTTTIPTAITTTPTTTTMTPTTTPLTSLDTPTSTDIMMNMETVSAALTETQMTTAATAVTNESTVNNEVEIISTPQMTSNTAAEQTASTTEASSMSDVSGTESTTVIMEETSAGASDMSTIKDLPTTTESQSTLETLQRRKKSIVDFVFSNPPYIDDYLLYRSYNVGAEQSNTNFVDDKMFLANGLRSVQVTYMHYDTIMEHAYLPHLEASALRLPLDSERYYLLVVLPSRGGAGELGRLLARMARESDLKDVYAALRPRRVRAIVPSFTVKGHVTLTTDLQKLGIRDVFEPRQHDFSPMTLQSGVYVRSIEQAVSVAIRKYRPDEQKKNRYITTQQRVYFSATYPFLYFVMDASIHVALMAGKMVDPLNTRIL